MKKVTLAELVRFHYGVALKSTDRVETGQYDVFGSSGAVGKHTHRIVDYPTIIVGRKGSVGSLTYAFEGGWPIDTTYYTEIRDSERLHLRYLYYALQQAGLERHAVVTAIPGINRESLYRIEVPLPPLAEQRRIADILDKADAIRRKRRVELTGTMSFAPSLLFHMFGDPRANVKRWERLPLANLVRSDDKINYGVVQPGGDVPGGVPLVRVGDFCNFGIDVSGLKTIDPAIDAEYKRSRLCGDEVLVACVGSVGLVALADERVRGFNTVRAVARIRCGPRINRTYLAHYLATPAIQQYFRISTRTVSQPTLNIGHIEETPILVPPIGEQERFAAELARFDQLKTKIATATTQADALFHSLVQRAFRGEL